MMDSKSKSVLVFVIPVFLLVGCFSLFYNRSPDGKVGSDEFPDPRDGVGSENTKEVKPNSLTTSDKYGDLPSSSDKLNDRRSSPEFTSFLRSIENKQINEPDWLQPSKLSNEAAPAGSVSMVANERRVQPPRSHHRTLEIIKKNILKQEPVSPSDLEDLREDVFNRVGLSSRLKAYFEEEKPGELIAYALAYKAEKEWMHRDYKSAFSYLAEADSFDSGTVYVEIVRAGIYGNLAKNKEWTKLRGATEAERAKASTEFSELQIKATIAYRKALKNAKKHPKWEHYPEFRRFMYDGIAVPFKRTEHLDLRIPGNLAISRQKRFEEKLKREAEYEQLKKIRDEFFARVEARRLAKRQSSSKDLALQQQK